MTTPFTEAKARRFEYVLKRSRELSQSSRCVRLLPQECVAVAEKIYQITKRGYISLEDSDREIADFVPNTRHNRISRKLAYMSGEVYRDRRYIFKGEGI